MDSIIQVKDLTFSYNDEKKVIDNISFQIKKGDYVAILGHNGSGKSTIAKLLIGLLEADKGTIIVNDTLLNIDNLYKVRENIGIVFQNPDNQFIGATVRDDIAFGLENMCVDPKLMDGIIENYASKVSMEKFLDAEPTKLSGGQKQRVAIAGILAMKPNIIILDEATSMLDPKGKRDINQLIKELNQNDDITIISITHDIEEAKDADQVILLNDGKIVDEGKPDKVLIDHERLKQLELDVPFAYKISKGLQELGIPIDEYIDTNSLLEKLWQLNLSK